MPLPLLPSRGPRPVAPPPGTLEVRVVPHRDGAPFFLEDLVQAPGGGHAWRRRQGVGAGGRPFTVKFATFAEAEVAAAASGRSSLQRRSRELQAAKAQAREERRKREDALLLERARERGLADHPAPPPTESIEVAGPAAAADAIHASLAKSPWLRHVLIDKGSDVSLWISGDGLSWAAWGPFEKWERKRQIAARALVCDAFGEDPMEHWGRLRAKLLKAIRPAELDVLHRPGTAERLDAARRSGARLVVLGEQGFLWSDERGWEARECDRGGRGSRLWREGRIVSSNHGRIIVLPIVKADGTTVEGHTRNAPYQGRAAPREVPVEIPFAVYDELGRDETWTHAGEILIDDDLARLPGRR